MSVFMCDENGFLKNLCSYDLIQPPYHTLLNGATLLTKEIAGSNVMSFYVRGSVAAGRAYIGTSDVDLVLITRNARISVDPAVVATLTGEFSHLTNEIDFTSLPLNMLLGSPEFSRLRVYLKTQSVLLDGHDMRQMLPNFRNDYTLAQYMHPDLKTELQDLCRIFTDGGEVNRRYGGVVRPMRFWCVWTMRTLLRASGLLSMMKSGIYETDLTYCRDAAILTYPQFNHYLQEAYELALGPTDDPCKVSILLDSFLPILLSEWYKSVNTAYQ